MFSFHELAAGQAGYITRAQLHLAGMTDEQIERLVRRQLIQRPHPGVYLTGSAPPTWEGRVRAACMAAGDRARAMGRTAARLRGMDGAERHTIIEITAPVGHGPVPADVHVHVTRRLDAALTASVRGIPVSSVNQTLLEYAWLVKGDLLVERAVEDACRRMDTDDGPLRRWLAAECGRGVPGVTHLRKVLDKRLGGRPARSGFEVIVGSIIREHGLPLPERRPLVAFPPDQKFELDLAYLDLQVSVEAMGEKWHSTSRQRRIDAERRRVLVDHGWILVEVWWHDAIREPATVAARVREARRNASARIRPS